MATSNFPHTQFLQRHNREQLQYLLDWWQVLCGSADQRIDLNLTRKLKEQKTFFAKILATVYTELQKDFAFLF